MDIKKTIDDYESLDELISSQIERKNHITEVINLIQDQKFLEDDIAYAFSLVCKIKSDTAVAKEEVKKMKQLLPKIKILDEEVKCLESRINYAESNLPSKFNKIMTLEEDYDKENIISAEVFTFIHFCTSLRELNF